MPVTRVSVSEAVGEDAPPGSPPRFAKVAAVVGARRLVDPRVEQLDVMASRRKMSALLARRRIRDTIGR